MAVAVNLDAIAVVSFHNERVIRLQSVGYEQEHIELDNLKIHPEEKGTTSSLIRGKVFVKVLGCAAVYKRTEEGQVAFKRFIESL